MQDLQSLPKSLNAADRALKRALLVSFIIHLALLTVLPGFQAPKRLPSPRMIPVELVTIKPIKKKKAVRKKKPLPKKKPKKPKHTPKPKQAKGIYKALINDYVEELSQQHPTDFALPDISLSLSENLPETVIPKSEDLFSPEEIFTGIKAVPSAGMEKMKIQDTLPKGIRKSPVDSDTGIEWKGGPRKTVYRPPLPKISSKVEGDIQLKFWVDHDGRVSQMIVMKKLDAEVVGIALGYLIKWRFEPLPLGKNYLQWGIITLKIRLK